VSALRSPDTILKRSPFPFRRSALQRLSPLVAAAHSFNDASGRGAPTRLSELSFYAALRSNPDFSLFPFCLLAWPWFEVDRQPPVA